MEETLYPSFSVLLVDDENAWLRIMSMTLNMDGGINNVIRCQDSREVMGILESENVGLILLDINMPHISGKELLPQIVSTYPGIPVIIVSGLNQVDTAVESMQNGAFDFYVKTGEKERLLKGIQRAIKTVDLERENREIISRFMKGRLDRPEAFKDIITCNQKMFSIFQYIEAITVSSKPVLITGESGVGKELIARSIHELSNRKGPLVTVNVAGLDDSVFSDTLFGHSRGAFTGADSVRKGLVENASQGTLFMDEIGDLSVTSQVKLLRLLQEGEYFPLGSDIPKRISARVIVATLQDLEVSQASGKMRRDLYYRLCAHHVHVPPLRERKDDIPVLLDHFIQQTADELGKVKPVYPDELPVLLANYDFPGNIRELKGMVFDAMSTHKSKMLSMDAFKRAIDRQPAETVLVKDPSGNIFDPNKPLPKLSDISNILVNEAMKRSNNNQSIAARLLGVSQPALSKRLKKMTDVDA
ncbi:two component, sigma54 specific, transcriptional regulator, Fis family [Denitrovibrio acetiphilus DSM 12809]|uniref:Two component, sigma54 specific, transcriptional regulator, Fis family n=1 Tax=Denitrovibrio acetiphilus (strain DSM 12809 / NBRC 114555 / N2460) TaxID=522772 RepID=D4H1R7_DENA2|nr:sigma-54 dependent transcriptional regulator [Denitrovibrio acetiphilus]ADD68827.1 two component, sigma54 specific, transcriptional regulator, Fis family [Denitrovibrio acetiphilus DSM 12809]